MHRHRISNKDRLNTLVFSGWKTRLGRMTASAYVYETFMSAAGKINEGQVVSNVSLPPGL